MKFSFYAAILTILSMQLSSAFADTVLQNRLNDEAKRQDAVGYRNELDALANRSPKLYQATLDQQAVSNADAYEGYRKFKLATASNLDEALDWATPPEIAADMVDESGTSMAEAQTEDEILQPTMVTYGGSESVHITIHLGSQRMDVVGAGLNMNSIRVATGRPGYGTPKGCYPGDHTVRHYVSKKFNAPMPLSLFFIPQYGIALHLGAVSVPSHGCVHEDARTAQTVFDTANAIGPHNVEVCVVAR